MAPRRHIKNTIQYLATDKSDSANFTGRIRCIMLFVCIGFRWVMNCQHAFKTSTEDKSEALQEWEARNKLIFTLPVPSAWIGFCLDAWNKNFTLLCLVRNTQITHSTNWAITHTISSSYLLIQSFSLFYLFIFCFFCHRIITCGHCGICPYSALWSVSHCWEHSWDVRLQRCNATQT